MEDRIAIDPKVCHGQACIKGTRIPVYQILRMLANGDLIDELLEEYPSLRREDILACVDYGDSLAEEQVTIPQALRNQGRGREQQAEVGDCQFYERLTQVSRF